MKKYNQKNMKVSDMSQKYLSFCEKKTTKVGFSEIYSF
jgi:hypothetical protein